MFAGTATGAIYVWQTWTGNLLKSWTAHFGAVTCLKLSEDDTRLFSASEDTTVKVFYVPDLFGDEVVVPTQVVTGHSEVVTDIHVTEELTGVVGQSYLLVTGSGDKSVKLFRISKSSTQISTRALPAGVTKVGMAHDGRIFASCVNGAVFVCFPAAELVQFGAFHKGPVTGLALSLDCSRLVTCAEDGVKIWDTTSLVPLLSVLGPQQQLKDSSALLMLTRRVVVAEEIQGGELLGADLRLVSAIDSYLQFKPLQRVLTPVESIDKIPLIRVPFNVSLGKVKSEKTFCVNADSLENPVLLQAKDDVVAKLQQELGKQTQLAGSWAATAQDLYTRLAAVTEDLVLDLPVVGIVKKKRSKK